jgi:hypothetical protein
VRRTAATRILGILVIGVSIWGGIVPYVGPTFDFDMGTTTRSWQWTQSHWTLNLAPAVLGIVAGALLFMGRRAGAFLALIAGGWFVIGPTVAPLWQHGGVTTSGSDGVTGSRTVRVLEGIGYHNGTGVTLMLLGALALWLFASAPAAVEPVESVAGPMPEEDTRVESPQPAPV